MAYSTAEAREQILEALGEAADELALALACLGEAFEQLDETSAEGLETQLFGPVQAAYGRAMRTYSDFTARHSLAGRAFETRSPGVQSQGAKVFIQRAIEATGRADHAIAALQDSMLPIEAGDAALRAGLSGVRELIDGLPMQAREVVRTLGR
ncbi:MAG: hypothetical protein M3Z33_00600 [Actinomycetota bacterium]|nr:hypothetical protein [Actinomycetota bacterium]